MSPDYNRPEAGAGDWHEPLNENFADLGVDVTGEVATFADLPEPDGTESSNGARRTFLVRESRVVYRDAGDSWAAVAGLGSADDPVPGTAHFEGIAAATESGVVKAHELSGSDLGAKIERAVEDAPMGARIEVEPPADGGERSWDTAVTIDPSGMGATTLDFGGTPIRVSVDDPLVFDTGGNLNLNQDLVCVRGGEWRLPDSADAAVRLRDCFRMAVLNVISVGNHDYAVAVENYDSWSEAICIDGIYAAGGCGGWTLRPAVETDPDDDPESLQDGSGSFIHSTIGTRRGNWVEYPAADTPAFRTAGSLAFSEVGMHRVSFDDYAEGEQGVAFQLDGNHSHTPIGPLESEQGSGGNVLLRTGPDYQPPAYFRGLHSPHGDEIVRTDGDADPIPVLNSTTNGFAITDAGTEQRLLLNTFADEARLEDFGTTHVDRLVVQSGDGNVHVWQNDHGTSLGLRIRDTGGYALTDVDDGGDRVRIDPADGSISLPGDGATFAGGHDLPTVAGIENAEDFDGNLAIDVEAARLYLEDDAGNLGYVELDGAFGG